MEEKVKTQEEIDDEAFPAKDFKKSTFNFSTEELTELQPLQEAVRLVQTFLSLGQIAQKAADSYVSSQVLTRLGVKSSQDTKATYDIEKNRILVYEPRLWCSVCNAKKAEFKYQDKIYCKDCIEKIKQELAKPIEKDSLTEKPAETVEKKKKKK